MSLTAATCRQVDVIVVWKPVLICFSGRDIRERRGGISAGKNWRQDRVGDVAGWTHLKSVGARVGGRRLAGQGEVGSWRSIFVDDAFGEQIPDAFALGWFVGGEHMVKGPVFSNDHDYMLDRGLGFVSFVLGNCKNGCDQLNRQGDNAEQRCGAPLERRLLGRVHGLPFLTEDRKRLISVCFGCVKRRLRQSEFSVNFGRVWDLSPVVRSWRRTADPSLRSG